MNEKRSSNFELLRIISIFLIISYHYGRHGVYSFYDKDISINKEFINLLSICGQLGVSIFILITGYFLIYKSFSTKRIFNILLDTWIYSLLGLFVYFLIKKDVCFFEIKKSFFPIIYERYWFITSYVLLLFLSPYINNLILGITKEKIKGFIIVLVLFFSFIRTIFIAELNYSNLVFFILLYTLGAYFRIYKKDFEENYKIFCFWFLLLFLFLFLIMILIDFLPETFFIYKDYLTKITSFPLLLISIFLFLTFLNIPIFHNKIVNDFSSRILAIYLIHDNDLLRNYIWRYLLKTPNYQNSNIIFIHFIFSLIIIFSFSLIFDYCLRKLILDKIRNYVLKYSYYIDNKIKKYI